MISKGLLISIITIGLFQSLNWKRVEGEGIRISYPNTFKIYTDDSLGDNVIFSLVENDDLRNGKVKSSFTNNINIVKNQNKFSDFNTFLNVLNNELNSIEDVKIDKADSTVYVKMNTIKNDLTIVIYQIIKYTEKSIYVITFTGNHETFSDAKRSIILKIFSSLEFF